MADSPEIIYVYGLRELGSCVLAMLRRSARALTIKAQEAAQFLPKKRIVQGKCPLHFLNFNGVVCSNTLFSNTSALTSSLLFRGNSTCNILEHLVWSNTSGFQFWGPLARTNFLSAVCGLPKSRKGNKGRQFPLRRGPFPLQGHRFPLLLSAGT